MHYDLVSSLITVGALTTVMGLWMLAASYAREESNAVELRIWGLSCLVFGVSFALFATRAVIPIFWSLVVGNFFFGLGFGGFGAAIAHLFNRRFPYRTVLLGILVCSLALYATEVIHGDSSWRVLILAAVTVEFWTHLGLDWVKGKMSVRRPALGDPGQPIFWTALGIDQLAHALVLVGIAFLALM